MVHQLARSIPEFRPVLGFLLILICVFTVETSIMLLLPQVMAEGAHHLVPPFVDAVTLTLLMSPVVWHLIVKPLRRVASLRSQVLAGVLAAQEEDRRRLARDLHDEVGQALTTLLIGLRTLEESTSLEEGRQRARQLRDLGGKTHDEIRRLARGLRPTVLDDLGLMAALERMGQDFTQVHGVQVHLDLQETQLGRLPEAVELTLFRIIQEAMNNVARHAHARNLWISVQRGPGLVRATARDDGRGFDAGQQPERQLDRDSIGLSSMRERAILMSGNLTVHSQPGAGTTIEVLIPCEEKVGG